ncbi:MAG TPA: hypothetical protein VJ372_21525 [Pyrinomonadaceae bacterium]|jgi:hypothetical protein|nr:hypothetical protein [Pyrinomonadaceae bacterium]
MRSLKTILVFVPILILLGCNTLAQRNGSGVVVSRRAQIRSSTAVVAADLLQVTRGDQVDILDSVDVTDPNDNTRKERWLRVRGHDDDNTEGWIESRNVMPKDVLDASKKLAAEDDGIPAQASGQLRASSNLRLSPDRSGNENIMMRLDSGSSFDIVGWKRIPKPKSSEAIESDVAPKAGSAQQSNAKSGRQSEDDNEPEETNELWYKVRLPAASSPAPAGWIYGKQVELSVPSDIIFYRTGREFVAWQRLDGEVKNTGATNDKDVAREAKPGSWLILEKSSSNQPHTLDEPDFDRIYVLGYDKRNQEHYTAYRSPDLKGFLPAKVEGQGDNKTFTLRLQEDEGAPKTVQFGLNKDTRGVLKVTPPTITKDRRRK